MARIILAHASEDKPTVFRIAKALRVAGHDTCLDDDGSLVNESLIAAHGRTEFVVVCLSKAFAKPGRDGVVRSVSEMQQVPVWWARFLMVRLDETALPHVIARRGYVDLFPEGDAFGRGMYRILHTIERENRREGPAVTAPLNVFISYAPADHVHRSRLEAHLGLMKRQGRIQTWHRGQIGAGQQLRAEAAERIMSARIVLLLISADYLASDDCYKDDMEQALARHDAGKAWMIPIIIHACDWESAPFGRLTVLPAGGIPVTSWPNQNEAWANVVRGIRIATEPAQLVAGLVGGVAAPAGLVGLHARSQNLGDSFDQSYRRHARATSPSPMSDQLRVPAVPFIGREGHAIDIIEHIGLRGAIISGRNGMGKTSLARRLVQELSAHFTRSPVEIDLMGASLGSLTSAMVMERIIKMFEPEMRLPSDEAGLAARYQSVLARERTLLLFDNVGDRAQLDPLLPPGGCLLLITSAEHFTVPDMYAVRLDAFKPAEAVALVRSIAPRVEEATASEIAELCGYIPLALCVAASGLVNEGCDPADYLVQLRASLDRHEQREPVAAVLSVSLGGLAPPLRELWLRLGVFQGDIAREVAAVVGEVCLASIDSALLELKQRGLIEHEPATGRYRQNDAFRHHARSWLATDALYRTERRHVEHYRNALYKKVDIWNSELANIRAAQAWASAHAASDQAAAAICLDFPLLCGSWPARHQPSMWRTWIQDALAAATKLGLYEHFCDLQIVPLSVDHLAPPTTIEYHERRLAVARETGDRYAEAVALRFLGDAHVAGHDRIRAITYREQQVSVTREIGEREWELNALKNLADCYSAIGNKHNAVEHYERTFAIAREIGNSSWESNALYNLGRTYTAIRDPRAMEIYEQILAMARKMPNPKPEAEIDALCELGESWLTFGECRKGIEIFEQALAVARQSGNRLFEGGALDKLGTSYVRLAEPYRAVEYYEQALLIAREVPNVGHTALLKAMWNWNAGKAYEALGDLSVAIDALQVSINLLHAVGQTDAAGKQEAYANQLRARLKEQQRGTEG